ncbi:MAG: tetratricopeptide repeat protein [Gammaproteobacteria bacterium]|jgi:serine/threonine-protein kinase|nr:tetratricopeptide repeat protein [Gammaproteobacteria bacterium]
MTHRPARLTPLRRRVLDAEFERLLELDEAQRAERLRELADRCPRATRRLRPLLEAMSEESGHLEAMIREVADSAVNALERDDEPLEPGTRLGAWRLTRFVGRGGMGHVYRAARADGAFRMNAAVKVIRLRRDHRLSARLAIERQLLARLDHPNIARILDGGTTEDGLAWLVMEWVDGHDLHRCREQHGGDHRACLALFLRLAEAVSHAHQRQVVHGDIKPANIRVGEDGRVRLLDFGVARLLADDAQEPLDHVRALTPAWSAPELRAGEIVSTQSDIWALGALLYWMLTGERFDPDPADDRHTLADRLPPHLPRRLDLAAIIATAGARDSADRYHSAFDIIRDVERYRARRPVLARPATRRYVLTRFIQRNPFSTGLSGLAVLLLALGLAGTSWQAREAALERDRVRLEAQKTEKVSEFLVSLFEAADPWLARERNLTVHDLVERGADRIRVLRETPQVQAEMYQVLARVHRGLADYEKADRLASEAVAVLEGEGRATPAMRAEAIALRASTLGSQGRYQEAEAAHRRALALVAGEPPTTRARFMNDLGLTLYSLGRLGEARGMFEQALAIRSEHQPDSAQLAESYNNLALLHATVDQHDQARELYEAALELRRAELGMDHPTTSFTLTNLATLLVQTGRAREALPAYREALAIRRNAFGDSHPAVASVLYQLGWANANLGQPEEARAYYEQALALRSGAMGDRHPSVAVVLNALAAVARAQGRHEEALDQLGRAFEIYRETFGDSHHDLALVLANLGTTHIELGHLDRGGELLEQALEMNRAELGENHHHVADNLKALADLHLRRGDRLRAARYARQALAVYDRLPIETDHPAIDEGRQLLARIDSKR